MQQFEISSRIAKFIRPEDIYKYSEGEKVEEHLEELIISLKNNNLVNINFAESAVKKWNEIEDVYILEQFTPYFTDRGGYIIEINTPIIYNIAENKKSWSTGGFGYYQTSLIYIRNFEDMLIEIKELEEELFDKAYKKEYGLENAE